MMREETVHLHTGIYDIEICVGVEDLQRAIRIINSSGWPIVAMTQNEEVYTVLFRRPANRG